MATIRIKIPDDKIKDLLCGAFESGGSNGWCRIKSYNYPKGQTQESLHIEYPHLDLPLIEGGSLTLENIEDPDTPKYQPRILDRKACLKGLVIMAKKYPHSFANFMAEDGDMWTGDTFLQCAVFHDTIYG